MTEDSDELIVAGTRVARGERATVPLPLVELPNQSPMAIPVKVVRGSRPGPRLLVVAGVHGDELVGMEVVRRLLSQRGLRQLRGDLLAVPCANPFGFIHQSRYLPDRRDLNRAFPGSRGGSLAGRVAHELVDHLIRPATHVLDLHTGAIHRPNLPQVRANLDDEKIRGMARAFGAPFVLAGSAPPGSLRHTCRKLGIPVVVYEGGEALRVNEMEVRAGVRGTLRVMRHLGMLPKSEGRHPPTIWAADRHHWVRSPSSGFLRSNCHLGKEVRKGDLLGVVGDALDEHTNEIRAKHHGVVIGMSVNPAVHGGEAVIHLAHIPENVAPVEIMDSFFQRVGPIDAPLVAHEARQTTEPPPQ